MEKNTKNQTTSFLMVVGIIFIVISGTIFVSTAWQYIPVYGKQCILLLASFCLFACARKVEKNGAMEKTETALYYLAASFLGLFTLSVCGWITETQNNLWITGAFGWSEESILIASIVMFIPIVMRFVKKRKAFDFTLTALLADWIVFWFALSNYWGLLEHCILSASGLTAYTLADFLRKKWIGENKPVEQIFLILYKIHAISFVLHNLSLTQMEDGLKLKMGLFIMAAFMVCITALSSLSRKHKYIFVFNSLAVYWLVLTGISFVNEYFSDGITYLWSGETAHFISFSLCAICMILFSRKEMFWITMVWGLLIPFVQLRHYGDYPSLFSRVDHQVSVYLPFTAVLITALFLTVFKKFREGKIDIEEAKQFGKAAGVQILVMLILFYASKYPFWSKGLWSILMLQNLTISFLFKNTANKIIFRCYALFYGEILAFICTADFIPVNLQVEQFCLFIAIGVYLLGIICNNHGYGMRTFQFICICIIMVILLCHGLWEGEMENALILGITGLGMLICAALLGSHRYMVLSSVILILMAFYITRSFWFSIQWWVYLFAAGIVLVALAIKKEKASRDI